MLSGSCVATSRLALSSPADAQRIALEPAVDDGLAINGAITCPLTVGSEFVNSWGDSRSGGRQHQGVDMAAPQGTAVVAAGAGTAEFTVSNAGGNAIWLTTPEGDKFYYAHLDDWNGESREVQPGEVIDYVGSTGNARGNHLRFETHPGGTPTNPYPIVVQACTDAGADVSGSNQRNP